MMIMQGKLLLAALIGTTLSGCGTFVRGADMPSRGLVSVNQPVVSRSDYVFDLPAYGYEGVSANDAQRLEAWFQSLQLRYGDTVYVDDSQGSDPARRAAIAAIAAITNRYGLFIAGGAPVTEGRVPEGNVRVIVSRTEAYVPNCPNWSKPSQPNFDGSQDSNFGCAMNSNLAAMIANPEDLVQGRQVGGATDPAEAIKGLTTWRARVPTGTGGTVKSESAGGK
ncbi:MAG: Flp pilus assembly protein CpaD [uncultured Sphingomonadaceae bacterium]|uniref:Flp pilus assembly protein CpaD n=1 Tax=uncultured Sphingomonadaceae bacterium TaxID=169976 RepID=A0A6J4S0S4_9SPHN|nr:MAG: Flp pilus assembly protein CpaD [uncultured Sphingomonadaceae bacterium]